MNESLNLFSLLAEASELAERLKVDILLCKTREEHIRITARANEAATIVSQLKLLVEKDSE